MFSVFKPDAYLASAYVVDFVKTLIFPCFASFLFCGSALCDIQVILRKINSCYKACEQAGKLSNEKQNTILIVVFVFCYNAVKYICLFWCTFPKKSNIGYML